MAGQFDFIRSYFTRMAGGETIRFNNSVFLAMREQSDRNFALAYQLQEHHCFPPGTSIQVRSSGLQSAALRCRRVWTCGTSAAAWRSPARPWRLSGAPWPTGASRPSPGRRWAPLRTVDMHRVQVLRPEAVRDVLSLLHSCGFYEYSGYFAFKVGIPGKSSIAGSMMMVLPNTMGICLWSPALDKYGNSSRGLHFMSRLTETFSFHR